MTARRYLSPDSGQFFAFNVWDIASALAVIDAASNKGRAIILQTSMKAFSRLQKNEFRTFITQYAARTGTRVYLHLDHCRKQELFEEAIEAGWDSVMIDVSDRPLEENIRKTNEICELAHARNVLVESEIGHVGTAGEDKAALQELLAKREDIEYFIKHTDADSLAIAIGTAHGLYHGVPHLHYELLEETGAISDIPLVIHGGTGLSDDTFRKLLAHRNVKKINISTAVKQAYLSGILKTQEEGRCAAAGFDPLAVTGSIHESIQMMATHYLSLQDMEDSL